MNKKHMDEIVQNLIGYALENTKFDKEYVMRVLTNLGWTDSDIKYFDAEWMFKN